MLAGCGLGAEGAGPMPPVVDRTGTPCLQAALSAVLCPREQMRSYLACLPMQHLLSHWTSLLLRLVIHSITLPLRFLEEIDVGPDPGFGPWKLLLGYEARGLAKMLVSKSQISAPN